MKILQFERLESTQIFLINALKDSTLKAPICVMCEHQSGGVGSRGNAWVAVESGLYFSFALPLDSLPNDLEIQSQAIFFGFICKETLRARGSGVWLKYPNDLYLGDKKLGGVICSVVGENVVCGIGINLKSAEFGALESGIVANRAEFVENLLANIPKYTWKRVFGIYKREFGRNLPYSFHHKGRIVPFRDAQLLENGALRVNGEILYTIR